MLSPLTSISDGCSIYGITDCPGAVQSPTETHDSRPKRRLHTKKSDYLLRLNTGGHDFWNILAVSDYPFGLWLRSFIHSHLILSLDDGDIHTRATRWSNFEDSRLNLTHRYQVRYLVQLGSSSSQHLLPIQQLPCPKGSVRIYHSVWLNINEHTIEHKLKSNLAIAESIPFTSTLPNDFKVAQNG